MALPKIEIIPLERFRPQTVNANAHTARGHAALGDSVQADGWIGALTVAADQETFDGSDRLEIAAEAGFDEAIVVESDGTRPVIIKRTDIPTAADPRAQRLGIAANRVAQLNLAWKPMVLADMQAVGIPLAQWWHPEELAAAMAPAVELPTPGDGGDDFDPTPDPAQTRVQVGDLWALGDHRLLCGDSTNAGDVARLMGGARAKALITDPPYGVEYHSNQPAFHGGVRLIDREFGADRLDTSWLPLWFAVLEEDACAYVFSRWDVLEQWRQAMQAAGFTVRQRLLWDKSHWTMGNLDYYGSQTEDILFATKGTARLSWEARRGNLVKTPSMTYSPEARTEHATQKPLAIVEPWIADSTQPGDLFVSPFLGSGTEIVAAHRTGRICYGLELEPRYCDVILRRAAAEGIGPIELIAGLDNARAEV